jgi:hypothetical protein
VRERDNLKRERERDRGRERDIYKEYKKKEN